MSVIVCVCANEMEKEITMRLRVFGAFDREEREGAVLQSSRELTCAGAFV